MRIVKLLSAILFVAGCGGSPGRGASGPWPAPQYTVHALALPGGGEGGILMDYLAYDPETRYLWVPAGNTGNVNVIDTTTSKVKVISGFAVAEMERRGRKRVVGPSSATVGVGVVYVGNRANNSVCALDRRALTRAACGTLDAMPDGIAYVPATKEVGVTTPRDKSIRILDGTTLAEKARLPFDGEPEGFAVDGKRGRFYTNLEDLDRTLAIDVKSRATVATWQPGCGEEGPHGLALDEELGFLFVACSARAEVLDAGHAGAVLSSVDTGDGVDDLDYVPAHRALFAGAARAAKLTVATVDPAGQLRVVATVPTQEGARNGKVASDGSVYLAHSAGSALVVVSPVP
jgi:DNA-binding beta-propeller fold protein YncE